MRSEEKLFTIDELVVAPEKHAGESLLLFENDVEFDRPVEELGVLQKDRSVL